MKTYRQYVEESCGGWGWEVEAHNSVRHALSYQNDMEYQYVAYAPTALSLSRAHWVEALVFFLMGVKHG